MPFPGDPSENTQLVPPEVDSVGGGGAGGQFLGGGRYWRDQTTGIIWQVNGDGSMTPIFGEGITVLEEGQPRPPTSPGGGGGGIPLPPSHSGIDIPVPPQTEPPPLTGGQPPTEPLAPEVPEPPNEMPLPIRDLLDVINDLPVGPGVPNPNKPGLNVPDWLKKLLTGLMLAGALHPPDDEGGGPISGGGKVVGGGASGGTPGLGTLGYKGMKGGGNYQAWNPGAGQAMLGGGGGGNDTGAMMAQLFAGRR